MSGVDSLSGDEPGGTARDGVAAVEATAWHRRRRQALRALRTEARSGSWGWRGWGGSVSARLFRLTGVPWKMRLRHHINLVRWTLDRCDGCGHRFAWKGDARFSQNSQTFHESCLGWQTWRRTADERMQVLEIVCDVWQVKADDVRELMANRAASEGYERSDAWNLAWRVFYQMDQRTEVTR